MKPQITMSLDTQMLYERLEKAQIGDLINYEELSAIIGSDVQIKGRGSLQSARKMAMRDKGMVFESVRDIGIKRLADAEIVRSGQAYISRIRRHARRGMRVLVSVQNFEALPNDLKIRHNATASMLGAVAQFSGSAAQKRIEGAVEAAGNKISYAKTLELFGGAQ